MLVIKEAMEVATASLKEVSAVVEGLIDEVRAGGDAAVRALSERLDHWSPVSFRLSQQEIDDIVASVPDRKSVV